MSERLKRILFIAFFIVFTVAIGLAIYFVFFQTKTAPGALTEEEEAAGAFPGSGEAEPREPGAAIPSGSLPSAVGITGSSLPPGLAPASQTILLKEGVTQELSASTDGTGVRYYDPLESKFYRVATDGVIVPLSDRQFPNVENVSWGNATDQAILTFPDGSNIHYNFTTEKQTTLPKHWNAFDFANDDLDVIAKSEAIAPESRFLIISDPDGTNARAVEPLGDNADKTFPSYTPNNQIVAYATVGESKGFDRESILLIGKNHENYQSLLVEGRGFLPLWSPNGQKILYSVWNVESNYRPDLWISGGAPDNMNQERVKLEINTWADKCVWADDLTVYCAVPQNLPRGAALQRELFNDLSDDIFKIDLRSGAKTLLGAPEGGLSVRNPVVTDDGTSLIFSDAVTGDLYSFRLQ